MGGEFVFAGGLACLHFIYILFMVFGSLSGKPIFSAIQLVTGIYAFIP